MSFNYRGKLIKSYLIIAFWIIAIILSFSAREALTGDIQSSTEIISSDSESTVGSDLYKARFNITESDDVHILILQLPDGQDFRTNPWRNYTIFLVQYLNDTLFEHGYEYEDYFAEPILIKAGLDEFASALVSEDGTTATVQIIIKGSIADTADKLTDDVNILHNLLAPENVTKGIYAKELEFRTNLADLNSIPIENIPSTLPDETESEKVNILLTGNSANFVDLLETSKKSFEQSEILAIIVAIVILSLVFKSPLGIIIPLVAMGASLFPTYYITTFLGTELGLFAVSDFLPAIIGMIGIAVAVDYNLFSLVRFREEYRKKKAELSINGDWTKSTRIRTQIEASEKTNRTTGQAVMYSGITVIIGFSSMLLLGSDFTLGMAISVSVVVAISVLTARTLTPAILALWGDKLDWPNFMSGGKREIERIRGSRKTKPGFWHNWSVLVMKKPITFLFIGLLTMVPFVIVSSQTDLSFDFVRQLPAGTESRDGFEILQNEFDFGSLNPMQLVIDLGNDTDFFSPAFQAKSQGVLDGLEELAVWAKAYSLERTRDGSLMEFGSVSTFSIIDKGESIDVYNYTEINGESGILNLPAMLPAIDPNTGQVIINPYTLQPVMINNTFTPQFVSYISGYINFERGNNTILMDFTTNLDPGSAAGWEQMRILRDKVSETLDDIDGIEGTYVTGLAAFFNDGKDDMYENVPLMLTVAVLAIFLSLMILFRSIALPIKAILTISGSILFGLGSLVMVFEYGWFNLVEINGFTLWQAEQVGITYFLPTFLFTTILGLGMDYSILIISRIKEEYHKSGNMTEAVGIGIEKTAGVITSAATVMVATFLVFAGAPMLILKMMGMAMAIAIIVDATISRIILLPAAMKLLGDYNWWLPKWLAKILPKVELEH